ncbi:MAG: LysM peptidoglycan-binding domain-containing protein [Anaerolineales bacterium]|nr:LysM peptidoglycan-binding domain-containing protein [Anaerolineales bacterium]
MLKSFITLILVVFLAAKSPILPHSAEKTSLAGQSGQTVYQLANEVVALVNALREANGLTALNQNQIIMQIAQSQAEYSASIGEITHYGPDGSRAYQRALAAGFSVAGDLSLGGFFSENIMFGPNLSPQDVVSIWQGDDPHLNTMLSPNRSDIGAGVAISDGLYYYVLDTGLESSRPIPTTYAAGETPGGWSPALRVAANTPAPDGSITHTVRIGETLWTIAAVYGLTVEQLAQTNHLNADAYIFPGNKLVIREADAVIPVGLASPVPSKSEEQATAALRQQTTNPAATALPDQSHNPSSQDINTTLILGMVLMAFMAVIAILWSGYKKGSN